MVFSFKYRIKYSNGKFLNIPLLSFFYNLNITIIKSTYFSLLYFTITYPKYLRTPLSYFLYTIYIQCPFPITSIHILNILNIHPLPHSTYYGTLSSLYTPIHLFILVHITLHFSYTYLHHITLPYTSHTLPYTPIHSHTFTYTPLHSLILPYTQLHSFTLTDTPLYSHVLPYIHINSLVAHYTLLHSLTLPYIQYTQTYRPCMVRIAVLPPA